MFGMKQWSCYRLRDVIVADCGGLCYVFRSGLSWEQLKEGTELPLCIWFCFGV